MKPISLNAVAIFCLACSVGLMIFLFAESRNDPSLRIAALVSGTALVASLGSIASTILTGKDVTKAHDSTSEAPPQVPIQPVGPANPPKE